MEKECPVTERVLKLTLEILYLLTGENYLAFKLSDGLFTSSLLHPQSTIIDPPSRFLKKNKKGIEKVFREIIELLKGEVPIRCQDVSVYFSMEEWEYLEGHKDLYKDVMMENRPPLTSPDGSSNRNTPGRCPRPLYSRDSTQEHQEIPQEDQEYNLTEYGIEDGEEETHLWDGEEEEIPSDTTGRCYSPLSYQGSQENHMIPQDFQGKALINVKVENTEDEEDVDGRGDELCKEEECSPEIGTGGHPNEGTMEEDPFISPDCEIEVEITFDSPEEDLFTPNLRPVLQSSNLSSNPSTHERCFPDLTHPVIHQATCRGGEEFTCKDCGRSFDKRARLVVHQRSHTGEKPYLCSECGKCFAQTSHLFRHVKVHSERKPFLCSDCGRCFKEKAHLLRHQKIHMGIKPFVCPVCGKHFREKANLLQHGINHTGKYPYSCPECGKCFLSKSRLDVHQMSHSGEKPYTCSECAKSFLHKSVFVRHQKIHSGAKSYACSECGKCFRYQSHLTQHEKDHEGLKPYSCSDCGKCFSRRSDLLTHQPTRM